MNPIALHNEIMNGILNRIPGGHAMHQRFMTQQARNANAAGASRAAGLPEAGAATRTESNHQPLEIGAIPFSAILEHVSHGGAAGDEMLRNAIEAEIEAASLRHNLDPNLVRAVIRVESNYRHDAVSHAGAMGLMQLMPRTAESLGVTNPFDIRQNIDGGTRYLRRMLDMFDGDVSLALAAYNAGAGAVRRHGGIPPFRETQNHVPRVLQHFERYTIEAYQRAAEDSRSV